MYKYKLLLQTFLWEGHYAKICSNNRNFSREKGANVGLGLCVCYGDSGYHSSRAPLLL